MSFKPMRSYERSKIVKQNEDNQERPHQVEAENERQYPAGFRENRSNSYHDGHNSSRFNKPYSERNTQRDFSRTDEGANTRSRDYRDGQVRDYSQRENRFSQNSSYDKPYRPNNRYSSEREQREYRPRSYSQDNRYRQENTEGNSYTKDSFFSPTAPKEAPYSEQKTRSFTRSDSYQRNDYQQRNTRERNYDRQEQGSYRNSYSDKAYNSRPDTRYDNRFESRPERSYTNRYENRDSRPYSNRNENNFENKYENRGDNRFREGRTSRFRQNLNTLFDVDREILSLFQRRAELLQEVKRDKRVPSVLEKKLRSAWENGVARVTKDPRIARDFFSLLQQIEPIPYIQGEPVYFNLSPQFEPVNIDLEGAVSSRYARMFFALAAASGTVTSFNLYLSPHIMAAVKAFNQLGGQLWWEGTDRVLSRGGTGIMRHVDKVIPVGTDELTFYLVVALALLVPSRVKIVGDGSLRFLDTSALRRFLPLLNARMTTVIPGQEGIPIRVESAGMMPSQVELPNELPRDFITSLIITSAVREDIKDAMLFTLVEHPEAEDIAAELASVFSSVDIPHTIEYENNTLKVRVEMCMPTFTENVSIDLDPIYATALLAIPAFTGGTSIIKGQLNSSSLKCIDFLKSTGLHVRVEEGSIISEHPNIKLLEPDYALAPAYPFALVFSVLAALSGEEVTLPELGEGISSDVLDGFLAQIGLKVNAQNALGKTEVDTNPWFLPDGEWGLALSLLAFMRPQIRIVNPEVVSSAYPMFWRIYNTLPNPTLTNPVHEEENVTEEPTRRRIIAQDIEDLEEETDMESSEEAEESVDFSAEHPDGEYVQDEENPREL